MNYKKLKEIQEDIRDGRKKVKYSVTLTKGGKQKIIIIDGHPYLEDLTENDLEEIGTY